MLAAATGVVAAADFCLYFSSLKGPLPEIVLLELGLGLGLGLGLPG